MKHTLIRTLLVAVAALALSMAATALPGQAQAAPKAPAQLDTKVKEPQVFRYKGKPGAQFTYKVSVTQGMKMDAKGAPIPMPPEGITTTFDATIVNTTEKVLPDGKSVVSTSYAALDLKLKQGDQTVPSDMLKPQIEQFKQIKTTVTISPRGERTDTKIENVPMGQQGGPLQDALVGSSIIFPDKPLNVGDKWEQKVPLEMKQGMMTLKFSFKTDYTFLGYAKLGGNRVAVFQTDIYMLLVDQKNQMPGHKITMKGNGKGSGFIYFDQKAGQIAKSDVEMIQQIQTSIAPEGQPAQDLTMEISTQALMDLKNSK